MFKCYGQVTSDDLCHKNGRRQQLIDEIKQIIGCFDEKHNKGHVQHPRMPGVGGGMSSGMGSDLARECREYRKRKECDPPIITTIALHETRPTSDYSKMQYSNTSDVTYVDGTNTTWKPMPPAPWELPRKPSQELRAGNLYLNCECLKRNGLQHDCPRWHCGGRPECVAVNPGPCCWTSQARKPVRGDRRYPPKGYDTSEQQQTPTVIDNCEVVC